MRHLELDDVLARNMALAFDASPNPYMLLTPELVFVGANQAYLETVGRTREEMIGKAFFALFDGGGDTPQAQENAALLRRSFDHVLDTGQTHHLALFHYPIAIGDARGEPVLEERYWSATHTPVHGSDGRIAYILQHTADITELVSLRRRLSGPGESAAVDEIMGRDVLARAEHVQRDNRRLQSERNRLHDVFMQAPGFIAVVSGTDHVFQMHNRAFADLTGNRALNGKPVAEAIPEVADQGFIDLLDRVRRTGMPFRGHGMEARLRQKPDAPLVSRHVDFVFQPLKDADDRVVGVLGQGHDVTDAVLADRRQKLMIDELNHRVKNTLATVQSIAMQTARTHADPRTFAEAFQARLLSLSHTHDLLTRSHWEGARLVDILRHETEAFGLSRIMPNGPDLALGPAQALSMGMIFHELATNAAKYGALSAADGRIMVDWSLEDGRIDLAWRELGGPPASPPERRGYGSRLIERNVRHDLNGASSFRFDDEGLVFDLSFPIATEPS